MTGSSSARRTIFPPRGDFPGEPTPLRGDIPGEASAARPADMGDACCMGRDIRLPGAKPDHLIITMMKWIRTSRLSTQNSLSLSLAKQAPPAARPGATPARGDACCMGGRRQGLRHDSPHPPVHIGGFE